MMDMILSALIIVFAVLIVFCICRRCKKAVTTPGAITTTVVTVPNNTAYHVTTPYPVNPGAMPQPSMYGGHPSVPVGVAPSVYPTQAPYPTNLNTSMPLPMTNNMPYPPGPPNLNAGMVAQYPHPPGGNVHQNPPSYAEATGIYERQSAFNPNFK